MLWITEDADWSKPRRQFIRAAVMLNLQLGIPWHGHLIILGQNSDICEVNDIRQCVCACLVLSITPLPCVNNVHYNIHLLCKSENSEAKWYWHEVIALLYVCHATLSLYLSLLLRPNLHFLHAYYMLIRQMCVPQDTTVPDAFTSRVMICVSHSLATNTHNSKTYFPRWLQGQRCRECPCKGARQY